jgi:hypothetical protein
VQTELARIAAPPPLDGDYNYAFGGSVAISADWAVVTDPVTHGYGARGGHLYFYRRTPSGWVFHQSVIGPPGSLFEALAIDGDTLVAGDYPWAGRGRVHVFGWSGNEWVKTQELDPDGLAVAENPAFGASVALSGDVLVVGAPSVDHPVEDGGEIRIYERTGGTWQAAARFRLPPLPEVLSGEYYWLGISVAVSGNTVIAGAYGNVGAAFVYERGSSGWSPAAILENPSPHDYDNFGRAVDISGDLIVVGQPAWHALHPPRPGKAFLYERNPSGKWILSQEIRASDGYADSELGDVFGGAVALDGPYRLVVGAYRGRYSGPETGTVYLFEKGEQGWPTTENVRYVASDSSGQNDLLGVSVAIHDGFVVAGATNAWHEGTPEGKAYVFSVELASTYCETASPTRIGMTGSETASDQNLTLTVHDAPKDALGLVFIAPQRGSYPFEGQILCLGSPVGRVGWIQTGSEGIALHGLDFDAPWIQNKLVAGSTWFFQLAHEREAGSGRLDRLSNAIRLRLR